MFRMPSELIDREARNKIYGVVVAIVTNNVDPLKFYRVRVRFPWLANGGESGGEESDWCRIATFGAGKDRGMYVLPEVGDEVLVAFEHGDMGRPFVIGSLWNGTDIVHHDNESKDNKKNNIRRFKSRSGHILEFDDNDGDKKEKVTLKTKAGAKVVLDDTDSAKKIEIYDHESNNYVLIDNQNKKITVETKTGDILIKAKNTIRLEAKTIETKSDKDTTMEVGANFKMKAGSNMEMEAGSSGTVKSGSTLTVKGSTVNIN
jgi:uncharacterized protein involved in type VI secretion and phage assembly